MKNIVSAIFLIVFSFFVVEMKAQNYNPNHIIPMDSLYVVNKACAFRGNNGLYQCVMMPTEYNRNLSNGSVSLIIVDNDNNVTQQKLSSSTTGLVVNDIVIGPSNEIIFSGKQNNKAVIGQISATGSTIEWLRKDTCSMGYTAMSTASLNNTSKLVSAKTRSHFRSSISLQTIGNNFFSTPTNRLYKDAIDNKDISVSTGTGWTSSYATTIGRRDQSTMAISTWRMNSLIQTARTFVTLPTYWKWHEGGGAITNISPDTYVAVIDVRCDTAEIDGVLVVKFKSKTNVSILGSKIVLFPCPKVKVNDLYFIDAPTEDDVSINILGHFVNTSDTTVSTNTGNPFCIKMDTALSTYHTLQYALGWDTRTYMYKNYQLNKGVYNAYSQMFITTGSYDSHVSDSVGGVYYVENQLGELWYMETQCEEENFFPDISVVLSTMSMNSWVADTVAYTTMGATISSPVTREQRNTCLRRIKMSSKSQKGIKKTNAFNIFSTNGKLQIVGEMGVFDFVIYDMMGRSVMKGCTSGEINVQSLRKGMYIIRLLNGNKIVHTQKFVQ